MLFFSVLFMESVNNFRIAFQINVYQNINDKSVTLSPNTINIDHLKLDSMVQTTSFREEFQDENVSFMIITSKNELEGFRTGNSELK